MAGGLSESIEAPYIGTAVKALDELIESYESFFHGTLEEGFYAKFLPFVQSSAMMCSESQHRPFLLHSQLYTSCRRRSVPLPSFHTHRLGSSRSS